MSRAKELILKAKKSIFSDKIGNNPSIFKGEGYDFVELREYQLGDDIRKIDWNITAKLHQPYIKLFQEERELNIVAVSILTGSTYFGSQRFKQDLIAEIVSILGVSAIRNMDMFSSFIFADSIFHHFRPSKSIHAVQKGVDEVIKFNPLNRGLDREFLIRTLLQKVKRKSLIFIISDFYHPLELKYLAKRNEVIAIVVRDQIEEFPPKFGFATLIDSESGKRIDGNFSYNQTYIQNIQKHDRELFQNFRKFGIRYLKIYTHQNPLRELKKFFSY